MSTIRKQLLPSRIKHRPTPRPTAQEQRASLLDAIDAGVDILPGGHAIWKHASRRIRVKEGSGLVHRLWFESRNGPIPDGQFLLNICQVQDCIEPSCHFVSRYASLHVVRMTHALPCSEPSGAVCAPLRSTIEAPCVG